MRRIVIFPSDGNWVFERQEQLMFVGKSPLRAAIGAMEYGESLHGQALGYIIRLDHAHAGSAGEMITLHTEVFSPAESSHPQHSQPIAAVSVQSTVPEENAPDADI